MAECVRELAESGEPVPMICRACGDGPCKRDMEEAFFRIAGLEADNERLRSAQAELRAALCLIERKASQFSGTHWVAVEEIARSALEGK